MLTSIELIRFIPLCVIMGYAALSDWRTKEVTNKLWLYAIPGLFLTIIETMFFLDGALLVPELLSIAITVVVSYLFFALNQWGGADAKAFMTIGVSAPLFPAWGILHNFPLPLNMFPFITLFIASALTLIYTMLTKSSTPLKQRKVKLMPFMFTGLIIAVIL